jgi:hypothetical protein
MTTIGQKLAEKMKDSMYCYGKPGGSGLVNKSECQCSADLPCQAKSDKHRFHKLMSTVTYGDFKGRDKRIQEIKPQFVASQWWKDNIKE